MNRLHLDDYLPSPLDLKSGMRVLDVGTGHGTSALAVASAARRAGQDVEVVTVDRDDKRRSPFMRETARRGEQVRFVTGDAWRLPAALGKFDLVLCFGCVSQLIFARSNRWLARPARAIWRLAPEPLLLRACQGLVGAWRARLHSGGRIVIIEVDRDAPTDADARGVALYESEKWPLVPADVLTRALESSGFTDLTVGRSTILSGASREQAERALGLDGATNRWHAGGLRPRVPSRPEGDYALSWYAVSAWAPRGPS